MNFSKLLCLIMLVSIISTQYAYSQSETSSTTSDRFNIRLLYKLGMESEQLPENAGYSEESSDAFWGQLRLRINAELTPNWLFYTDARGFASTSAVSQLSTDESGSGRTVSTSDDDSFVQLRQLWLRYKGLTAYPDENLTLGLQRIKSQSSLLWDGDIESLVWRISTTRINFQIGAGEQFDSYRTNTDLGSLDQDKPRVFSELSYDWRAYHELTLSVMYAEQDSDDSLSTISSGAADGINGEWLWYGASLSSNWTKRRYPANFAYNLQWLGVSGTSDFLAEDGEALRDQDITAWAVDSGVRYDMSSLPLSFGLTYSQGSGGFDDDESNMYVQTGLHSNRSTYVGNDLYFYRYNEALRPDLTNLRYYSLFGSATLLENLSVGASVSKAERCDDSVPVYRDANPLDLVDGSNDLGWGMDVSFRHKVDTELFFIPISYYGLRNSVFFPGDAFPDDEDSTLYAVLLEIVGEF